MRQKSHFVRIRCLDCNNIQMEEFPKEIMARCNECNSLDWTSENE